MSTETGASNEQEQKPFKFFEFESLDSDVYRAHHLRSGSGTHKAAYGGLLFSQALAAAEKTVPSEFIPNALHSMFLLSVTPERPVDYKVRRLRDGRSFCTRVVDAEQDGKVAFTCQISFHIKEEGAVSHSRRMPDVPPPEELLSDVEGCRLFIQEEKDAKREIPKMQLIRMIQRVEEIEGMETLFEMRPTDLDAYFALKPMVMQTFYFWFKCPRNLPDDPALHRWLACYITDSTLVSAAYRPHVSRGFVPSMMFSLDHNVWIHDADFRADDWMLYEVSSSVAKNGRAFANANFWTRDGRLVMSTTQECLIRSRNSVSRI
uniref:Acyl-coenzyme A thioesterase 8 n=1 Tax=Steinernema glaseri TaxID=37863 RepID=A0A1I7Y5Q5_9BILA